MRRQFGGVKTVSGIPIFYGANYQRGYGLGALLRPAFRFALPLFKKGAIALGKQVLASGLEVGRDILAGKNVKASLKKHAKKAGRTLLKKGINKFRQRAPAQSGSGVGDIFTR